MRCKINSNAELKWLIQNQIAIRQRRPDINDHLSVQMFGRIKQNLASKSLRLHGTARRLR